MHKASELIFARTLRKRDGWPVAVAWLGMEPEEYQGMQNAPIGLHRTFFHSVARAREEEADNLGGGQQCMLCGSPVPACLPCPGMCFYDGNIFAAQRVSCACESLNLYVFPVRVRSSLSLHFLFSPFPSIDILFHPSLVCNFQPGFTDILAWNGRIREKGMSQLARQTTHTHDKKKQSPH